MAQHSRGIRIKPFTIGPLLTQRRRELLKDVCVPPKQNWLLLGQSPSLRLRASKAHRNGLFNLSSGKLVVLDLSGYGRNFSAESFVSTLGLINVMWPSPPNGLFP